MRSILFFILFSLVLVGCGGDGSDSEQEVSVEVETIASGQGSSAHGSSEASGAENESPAGEAVASETLVEPGESEWGDSGSVEVTVITEAARISVLTQAFDAWQPLSSESNIYTFSLAKDENKFALAVSCAEDNEPINLFFVSLQEVGSDIVHSACDTSPAAEKEVLVYEQGNIGVSSAIFNNRNIVPGKVNLLSVGKSNLYASTFDVDNVAVDFSLSRYYFRADYELTESSNEIHIDFNSEFSAAAVGSQDVRVGVNNLAPGTLEIKSYLTAGGGVMPVDLYTGDLASEAGEYYIPLSVELLPDRFFQSSERYLLLAEYMGENISQQVYQYYGSEDEFNNFEFIPNIAAEDIMIELDAEDKKKPIRISVNSYQAPQGLELRQLVYKIIENQTLILTMRVSKNWYDSFADGGAVDMVMLSIETLQAQLGLSNDIDFKNSVFNHALILSQQPFTANSHFNSVIEQDERQVVVLGVSKGLTN